jgi:biotin transporter BioY
VFAFSPELPQGAARLVGPTGGYLMAYPFAAFVTGMLATRGFDRRYLTSVLAMAAGLAVIFAGGVTCSRCLLQAPTAAHSAPRWPPGSTRSSSPMRSSCAWPRP